MGKKKAGNIGKGSVKDSGKKSRGKNLIKAASKAKRRTKKIVSKIDRFMINLWR